MFSNSWVLVFINALYSPTPFPTHWWTQALSYWKTPAWLSQSEREEGNSCYESRVFCISPLIAIIPAVTSTTNQNWAHAFLHDWLHVGIYRQRPFRSCRAWENLRNRMSAPRLPQKFVQPQGAHTICLCSRLLFYSKCTGFTVCFTYSGISLTMYINQWYINVELPYLWCIVVLLPQKRFFERFWMNLSSPLTVPYNRRTFI